MTWRAGCCWSYYVQVFVSLSVFGEGELIGEHGGGGFIMGVGVLNFKFLSCV